MSLPTSPAAAGVRRERFARSMGTIGCAAALWLVGSDETLAQEPRESDLNTYALCTAASQHQPLGAGAARHCSEAFLRIKLAFLPEIDPDGFASLSPQDRARANRAGYAAYRVWRLRGIGSVAGEIAISEGDGRP